MTPLPGQRRLGVVDRDSGFVHVLAKRAAPAGWQVDVHPSAIALERLTLMRLDALVVDPRCLGSDGEDYLAAVRETLPALGILVCAEGSTLAQRVRALRLGVDDWVAKPCHPGEILARLEAITRRRLRAQAPDAPDAVLAGDLEIRPDRFQAFVAGRSVELTRREFEVLRLLVEVEGRVLERADIYERVWGYAMVRGDRSVDVFVRKLRSKIELASPRWRYIHTHFGVGYRFQAERLALPEEEDAAESDGPERSAAASAAAARG